MTVNELRDTLNKITSGDAPIMLCHSGDTFYDGREIIGVMIMHEMREGEEEVIKVFIEED